MPLLTLSTNVEIEDIQASCQALSEEISTLLGKPESYVMVLLQDKQAMSFAGTTEPLALVELKSLGLPEDKTADFSSAICSSVSHRLNIPTNRIYIEFHNPQRHMWGWDKRTFG